MDKVNAYEELRKKFRVEKVVTKQEAERILKLHEGDVTTQNPEIPETADAAWELFVSYFASACCEIYKQLYFVGHFRRSKDEIKRKIAKMDRWIEEANEIDTDDCDTQYTGLDESFVIKNAESSKHEYRRLTTGFYTNCTGWFHRIWAENSLAAFTYGEYVLFYNYLKSLVEEQNTESDTTVTPDSDSPEILIDFVAKNFHVTEQNLINNGFLDANKKWIGKKSELVAFIEHLISCRYIKRDHQSTTTTWRKKIRVFFEKRYKISLINMFKPTKAKAVAKDQQIFKLLVELN